MKTVKIAMIGVGNISGIYLKNLTRLFKEVELIGVCDLVRERAEKAQQEYNIPKLYETMHDAFADPEVEVVLNLTRPYEHFAVSKAALEAGKIGQRRYESYLAMYEDAKDIKEWEL